MLTLHSSHPLFFVSPLSSFSSSTNKGVVSQQDNGKTFGVSNTIRIPVEKKDNGAALSCEAAHPALAGQKRIRHYRLDVNCERLTLPSTAGTFLFMLLFFYACISHENTPLPPIHLSNKWNTLTLMGQMFSRQRKSSHLHLRRRSSRNLGAIHYGDAF